jgi:hypothetical protein
MKVVGVVMSYIIGIATIGYDSFISAGVATRKDSIEGSYMIIQQAWRYYKKAVGIDV